ncbi:MAG: mechanosensitive ion channel family protein [Bacteroidota bacterium]
MQTPPDTALTAAVDSTQSVTEAATGALRTLQDWWDGFFALLPNLVLAALIVVVAAFVARVVRRVVRNLLDRAAGHAPQARNVTKLLATLAYLGVLSAGTFIALTVLNLDGVVTTLLAGAGVVGLALGFAFQDIASNFIAGILMAVRNPFVVGEIVETNGFMGTVRDITLRSTVIETFQGQTVIVPNAKVFGDPIVNYSEQGERRIDLTCGVGYGDDLGHAQQLAVEAIESLPMRLESKPVKLFYTEFGSSSINFVVAFWANFSGQADFLEAQSEAIKAVKAAFDAGGVTIPFPIQTLDFDPNGGVNLRAALKGTGDGAASEPDFDGGLAEADAHG